jgi:hypothetical protein
MACRHLSRATASGRTALQTRQALAFNVDTYRLLRKPLSGKGDRNLLVFKRQTDKSPHGAIGPRR